MDQKLIRHLFKLTDLRPPFNLLKALFGFGGIGFKDKLNLIKLNSVIKKFDQGHPGIYQSQTVAEFLTELGQSEHAQKNFWEILTLATLNDNPDVTTADGLLTVLKRSYYSGRADGFLMLPKTGLSELFVEPTERYLHMRGQQIVRGVGLKEIRVMNGAVQSFKFKDGSELKADLFVSGLPVSQFLKVMPAAVIAETPELQGLGRMQGSPIISIHLFFDRPVLSDRFIGSAGTRTHWFFTGPESGSGDEHKKLFQVIGVISGAYDLLGLSKSKIVALVCSDLKKICPDAIGAELVHALVIKEHEATLSSRSGINAIRPPQKVFDNFYIIGDWTRTGLPATIESAVKSARLMVEGL